jgi:maltose-binding protein MalE
VITRRKLLGTVGLAASASLLVACGQTAAPPPATTAPAAQPTTPPAGTKPASSPSAGASPVSSPAAAGAPTTAPAAVKLEDQLNIVQWSHFVPAYDDWFDKYADEWGQKNKVKVTVDHVQNLELPARLAAEAAAKTGHDIIQFQAQVQTFRYEKQLVDVGDLVNFAT